MGQQQSKSTPPSPLLPPESTPTSTSLPVRQYSGCLCRIMARRRFVLPTESVAEIVAFLKRDADECGRAFRVSRQFAHAIVRRLAAEREMIKLRRNKRFSAHQKQQLEAKFQEKHYISWSERVELSRRLALATRQIALWFRNRRLKYKRDVAKVLPPPIAAAAIGGGGGGNYYHPQQPWWWA